MAIPKNKKELIFEIENNYTRLKQNLTTISIERALQKELEGHVKNTMMSVSDLVAYLIGWGELVLEWNRKKENGETIAFPETGYKWNELGRLAQKFYSDYDNLVYSERLKRLDQTVANILQLVNHTTDEELYHKPWYNKWTKGRMIQLNTSSPYKNANNRIRKWIKTVKEIN